MARPLARIGTEGHQRAFGAGAGDRGELVGGDAIAAHERRLDPLGAHLPQDQPAGVVQAAPIDQVGAGRLDLGYQRGEVLVAHVDAFVEHFLDPALLFMFLRLVGEALPIRGLVVNDGDLLALEFLGDVVAGDRALLVVAPAGAEDVPHVAFRDLGLVAAGVISRMPFS